MSKVIFTQDDKQKIVTIKSDDKKLVFASRDFWTITNYAPKNTFTTKFTKEQWVASLDRNIKDGVVTLERKGETIKFKLSQIPGNVDH